MTGFEEADGFAIGAGAAAKQVLSYIDPRPEGRSGSVGSAATGAATTAGAANIASTATNAGHVSGP